MATPFRRWQARGMDLNRYTFRSTWEIRASKQDVFDILSELGSYPSWWPEIRRAERVGQSSFELTCRSLLPYDLLFRSTQSRRDPVEGVLEADLTGDLQGFSRWTITPADAGCSAVFDEEVDAGKPLLRRLALIARPAFKANHSLMMSHGQAGLQVYMAGYATGRSQSPPAPGAGPPGQVSS